MAVTFLDGTEIVMVGGVCLYVKDILSPTVINDICFSDVVESVWVKITSHGRPLIVGSIYRPPSTNTDYWNACVNQVEFILSLSRDVVILGDFNLQFHSDTNLCCKKIIEFVNLFELKQLITSPTRVTLDSKSIIDLIFTSVSERHLTSGVIPITLSDHFLTFTIMNFKLPSLPSKFITKRNYQTFNTEYFLHDLAFSPLFSRIPYMLNVEDAWGTWYNEFIRICNKHAPLMDHKIRVRSNP